MTTERPDFAELTPGASSEDPPYEDERRAGWDRVDPDRRLTPTQRDAILDAEEDDATRRELLTPHPDDSLEVKSALTRAKYEIGEGEWRFLACTADGCSRRLTYYGPTGVDHSRARCSNHPLPEDDTPTTDATGTGKKKDRGEARY